MDGGIIIFIIAGFIAQLIDGALGMGYGVSSNSFLLSLGLPPAVSSASVHAAEVFTTGVSGLSHLKFKNVDKALFKKLLIPGIIGGVIGAYLLSSFDAKFLKPIVAVYLLFIGFLILYKAFKKVQEAKEINKIFPLGLIGGFFDAVGGGGWGPIVTSTLVASGKTPNLVIGTVNLTEFFVTVCQSITFILAIGLTHWKIILGLMIGGVIAAPLAAFLCNKIPKRTLMVLIGLFIIILSVRTIYLAFA